MRPSMMLLLAAILTASLIVVWHHPSGYALQDRLNILASASTLHPAGTDELGRDRLTRTGAAVLVGMAGASAASLLASGFALLLGMCAAGAVSWVRHCILYLCDLFFTLPWLFLLMLVRSLLPLSMPAIKTGVLTFMLLALLGAPAFLRLNHERVSALLRSDWAFFARASRLRRFQVLQQMLPHLKVLFWTQFLLYVPACLIAEANLGALGLGMGESSASWGTMLAGLQTSALATNSYLIYVPMLVLVVVLVALELMLFEEQG